MEERRVANILTTWGLGFCGRKVKKGWFCGTDSWYVLLLFFYILCLPKMSKCKMYDFVLCPYIMKEVKQSNPSIRWLMFNLLSPLDLCMSASPALPRNCELSYPQEIQQTLNCRNKKSYWAFGKCSEQHCPSPAAKRCSRQTQYWWKRLAEGYCKIHATVELDMTVSLTGGAEHRNTLRKALWCAGCASITEYWVAARTGYMQQEEN